MKYIRKSAWYSVIAFAALVVLTFGCERSDKEVIEGTDIDRTEDIDSHEETSQGDNVKAEERKMVKLETTKGDIIIEVDETASPVTSANFLRYAEEGFFDGTIFHRVIPGFMIQGGGFTSDMQEKQTHEPIVNEAQNGLKNDRGTIAMARTNNPNSATAQFFINLINNDFLNYSGSQNPGYAVFGKVVEGMDTVDAIAEVETGRKGPHDDVPVEPVTIKSATIIQGK